MFFGVSFCRFLFVSSSSRVSTSGPRRQTPREGTFFYWGGGGGASEGRVLSKFFTNWGGSNLFYSPRDDISDIVHGRKHLITNSSFDGHPVR